MEELVIIKILVNNTWKYKMFWQDYCLRLTALQIFVVCFFINYWWIQENQRKKTKIQPNLNNPMASIRPFNRYSVLLFLCFIWHDWSNISKVINRHNRQAYLTEHFAATAPATDWGNCRSSDNDWWASRTFPSEVMFLRRATSIPSFVMRSKTPSSEIISSRKGQQQNTQAPKFPRVLTIDNIDRDQQHKKVSQNS